MAPGPKATALILSQEERAALERIARRRKTAQALAKRALRRRWHRHPTILGHHGERT